MSKTTINIEFDLEDPDDRRRFKRISMLVSDPEKVSAVFSRFYLELIRPVNKHGYNDSTLEELSQKDGGHDLINLLWDRFYAIVKEEGLEEFLD
jgi:hypothetical protein